MLVDAYIRGDTEDRGEPHQHIGKWMNALHACVVLVATAEVELAEGEGFEPILPSFDKRSTEGFEPFWKLAESTLTSPSSIPFYEWTYPTTIQHEIGCEHSHPPELGARIDRSD